MQMSTFNRACLSHRSYVFPRKFRVYFFWVEMIQFMLKLHEMTLKVDISAWNISFVTLKNRPDFQKTIFDLAPRANA